MTHHSPVAHPVAPGLRLTSPRLVRMKVAAVVLLRPVLHPALLVLQGP
jgi:hypothetical protein